jgi:hypothetical protein
MRAMMRHKLLKSETILPDDYPVNDMYVYIVDHKFTRFDCMRSNARTIGEWKQLHGVKEIRRCDIFGHDDAKLGDEVR